MHQVLLPEKLTQASYKLKQVFNAGGCLLLFTVNVVLTLEWLFVVVYKLVIVVLP